MSSPARPKPGRRALRVAFYVLMVPTWVLVAFICINGFEAYSEVGNMVLLALVMFFGVWAWWYQEDRDRRHGTNSAQADDVAQTPGA